MQNFNAFPPEINASNIRGPGAEPIWIAADAWDSLAEELHAKAREWANQVSATAALFQGPAARKFVVAARRYCTWLNTHAETASDTAKYLHLTALAYERAVESMIPMASIVVNRMAAWIMKVTNLLYGQNITRIVELECEYEMMWAKNAEAMNEYQPDILDIIERAKGREIISVLPIIFSARFSDVMSAET
ncbi:serine-rich protein [Mycobacterium haemophilum DSM 44634]|uniref:PPE family protein n=1 Tax=Mycobacterium haemophilum TaxID=29311 RepID=UPI0006D423ED|nr:PPE family protein [Mycobacterium haemophilum]ALL56233.1 hypothetical protein B586_17785 [Mycobacterium haemophilum DSM 44634]MCV7341998.1 PPE family protein [Mycobacterium haemophilum DSM 44634]